MPNLNFAGAIYVMEWGQQLGAAPILYLFDNHSYQILLRSSGPDRLCRGYCHSPFDRLS